MAKRKREMSLTELLLHSDRKSFERAFGSSFAADLERFFYFKDFFEGARQDYVDATLSGMQTLMLQQYPLTAAFNEPTALDFIKKVHQTNASDLIWKSWNIIEDMKKGIDVAANYPKLERWRAFYCNPAEPEVIGREGVRIHPDDTEDTINQRVDEENAKLRKLHEQKKEMMDAYYDLMQPLLFEHLPALQQLEGDHWVLFAMTIRDRYDQWRSLCEEMDLTIEYEMPQETIAWKHADWQAVFSEKFRKKPR